MQLNRFYAVTLAFLLVGSLAFGQSARKRSYWTINPHVGAANYVGDFTTSDDADAGVPDDQQFSLENTSYALGLNVGYHFHPRLSVRGGVSYFNANGTDVGTRNVRRNLEFESNTIEGSLVLTYQFVGASRNVYNRPKFGAYLFGGVAAGFVSSEVSQAQATGTLVSVPSSTSPTGSVLVPVRTLAQALGTDENRPADSDIMISIPAGIGVTYKLNDNWDLTAEFGLRVGLADNLDGVLDITTPYDDWYALTTVGVRRILQGGGNRGNTERCPTPSRRGKRSIFKRIGDIF